MTTVGSQPPTAFRFFLAGQAVSFFGDQLYLFGVVWWALLVTRNVTGATTILLAASLAGVLVAPLAGRLIDRGNRVVLLIGVNAAYALLTAVSGSLMVARHMSWPLLVGFAVLVAVADQIAMPAAASLLPGLVSKDRLRRANGHVEMWKALMGIVAPAVAGPVARNASVVGWLLVVDAATFAFYGFCLGVVRRVARETFGSIVAPTLVSSARELNGHVGVVWTTLARNRRMLAIIMTTTVASVLMAPVGVLVPAALRDAGSSAAGLAMSAFAIGVLVATQCARWIRAGDDVLLIAGLVTIAVGDLVFGFAPFVPVAFLGSVIGGAGTVLVVVAARTWFQKHTPSQMQGRIFSLRFALGTLARPVGLGLGGAVASPLGPKHTVAAIGALMAVLAVMAAPGANRVTARQPAGSEVSS